MKITFNEYITHIKISNARRADFLQWKDREKKRFAKRHLPIKQGTGKWKKWAVNRKGERIVLNPRVAGKPKFLKLAGNSFYSGYGHGRMRARLADETKKWFTKEIKKQKVKRISKSAFPIKIKMDIWCPIDPPKYPANFDLDNYWFYTKFFVDCLCDCGIIPDDTVQFVTRLEGPILHPIKDNDKRKMVFTITKDTRSEVQNI